MRSRTRRRELLSVSGLLLLHKRMFDATWRWAGQFRKADTNIGVPSYQVPMAVAALCADVPYQIEESVYAWDDRQDRRH
jgi:fido (protein-threonine AMPylation protein)